MHCCRHFLLVLMLLFRFALFHKDWLDELTANQRFIHQNR
ncbi:unnamed protein product [Coffea canephora]|uniref:Uncharacterized protein n=1 Tax=Coffea canephora TaxID=49390 RepID=A0A068UIW4_COFCA|nr:unnamed protein product [Coffea canephora]